MLSPHCPPTLATRKENFIHTVSCISAQPSQMPSKLRLKKKKKKKSSISVEGWIPLFFRWLQSEFYICHITIPILSIPIKFSENLSSRFNIMLAKFVLFRLQNKFYFLLKSTTDWVDSWQWDLGFSNRWFVLGRGGKAIYWKSSKQVVRDSC